MKRDNEGLLKPMKKYHLAIDGGEGGEKVIEAPDLATAWNIGEEWTRSGDWCFGGEKACLWVTNVNDEEDSLIGDVDISDVSYDSDKGEKRPYSVPKEEPEEWDY